MAYAGSNEAKMKFFGGALFAKLGLFWRFIFGISRLRHIIDYFQAEAEINWIKEHQPDIWAQETAISL